MNILFPSIGLLKNKPELKITIPYIITGFLWIIISDHFLFYNTGYSSANYIFTFGEIKGLLYVLLSGGVINILAKNYLIKIQNKDKEYERLFQENPVAMWLVDVNTLKILKVNTAASLLYGYTEAEFLQLSMKDITSETGESALAHSFCIKEKGNTDHGIWQHRKNNDKTFFYVNLYSFPVLFKNNNCRCITAVSIQQRITDENRITELNNTLKEKEFQLEQKIYEVLTFNKALNNSALVSITDLNGTILDVNDAFSSISGYTRQELIGSNHNIVNSGYHSKEFWNDFWTTITSGKSWRGDVRNRAKNGSYYWLDTVVNPIVERDGKISRFMSIRYEITQRKKIEIEQEQLLNDLSEYAFHTSHKLRAPVARLLGLMMLLKLDQDQQSRQMIMEKLQFTAKEVDIVIREMSYVINKNSYNILKEKRKALFLQRK